ncbi:MAG: HlyC/CorC family transporter [Candidatus Abyssobacteria bacterium SURF_17]|uniref:HlyC/CorC family transporter n=1 Tax=Candidatus Abyssobacteria bacterium SURF_17 TaxID=2093361 RepID=A0A419ERK3_9BACT|nr:MAG: HlyC/CorC family transporter [Candidatus Abyssubacteria bacterium SURF_17]
MTQLVDIVFVVALLVMLLMSGFFSGIETGLISLNRVALRQREEKRDTRAIILRRLLRKPERLLATILVGNNLVNVTITIVFLIWASRMWGTGPAGLITPLALTPLILIFGEILPKAVFRHRTERLTPPFAGVLQMMVVLLTPVVTALTQVMNRLTRRVGGAEKRSPFISREDVRLMFVEGEEEGVIKEQERKLIDGIIDFGMTTVREIIVPRIDMDAVRDDATWEELSEAFEAHGHSRLPVYHEKIDDIVGIVYVFDLMRTTGSPKVNSIREFIRPVEFVPESKKVHDLLHEFRQKQMFMAIVVDEYGGTAGLVTLEDLIEEIFGEIHDEYDVAKLPIINSGEGLFILDARMHKEEAAEILGAELPEGEYETIGGFVLEQLGRIPRKGESFRYNDFQVTVVESSERTVTQVKFKLSPDAGKSASGSKT